MTPSGWRTDRLGSGVDVLSGQHVLADECTAEPTSFPYLTGPADFPEGKIIVSKYVRSPKVQCAPGDILITIKGSGTGKLVVADQAYCISRQLAAIRPRAWARDFVAHVLASEQAKLHADASGLIPGLTREDLLGLTVLVPPLGEQRKIAAILSSVDDAIEATQAVIEQLQVVKKAMMAELLTRGLPGRHTRFKMTEIGEVPEEWEVTCLEEVARVVDCKHRTPTYVRDGYPVVRPRDVKESGLDLDACAKTSEADFLDLSEKHRPSVGDIVYSRNATFGVASLVTTDRPFTIGQDVCLILATKLASTFLWWSLNAPVVRAQLGLLVAGSTFQRINLANIRKLWVPLPARKEQEQISEALNRIESRMRNEVLLRDSQVNLKSSLMSVLLTGEVRVKPDEEAT
jgi:type I restriction enzyme S subunit